MCCPFRSLHAHPDFIDNLSGDELVEALANNRFGLRFVDALYLTVVTASTVGFGDVYPRSWFGRMFSMFFLPLSILVMSKAILDIAGIPVAYRRLRVEERVLNQFGEELEAADLTDLMKSVDASSTDGMTKNDFILAMAMRLGKVKKYDLARTQRVFEHLDKDRNGYLDQRDILDLVALRMRRTRSSRLVSVGSDS